MATKRERIRLIGLKIRNLYRIEAAELEFGPDVGLYEITGNNREGKTSLLRIIMGLIMGKKYVSENALNDQAGKDSGEVKGIFDNGFQIERRNVSARNPKGTLVVVDADGGKHGQATIDGWLGAGAGWLSLGSLRALPEAKLTEVLLSIGQNPDLPKEVEALDQTIAVLVGDRSPWYSQKQRAERTRRPEGDRPEAVDVSAESAVLATLTERAASRVKVEGEIASDRRAAAEKERQAEEIEEQLEGIRLQARTLKERQAQLLVEADRERRTAEAMVSDLEAMQDPAQEIQEVKDRLAAAEDLNTILEPWKDWDRAQDEVKTAGEKIREYDAVINDHRAKKSSLLAEAGIPVRGIGFTEEGQPLLYDRPLDLASGRQWIDFEVDVAVAKDPDLRLVLLDEAHGMDQEGMQGLKDEMDTNDLMAVAVRIEPSGVGEVIVCDGGRAWNVERSE